MITKILFSFSFGLMIPLSLFGEIQETWDFTAPDGTPLTEVKSNLGTEFLSAASSIVAIRNNELEFYHDGTTPHTFRQTEFSGEPLTSGVCEISWKFTKVDFLKTAAVSGTANIAFDLRDLKGTRQNVEDDIILAGLRLRFDKNTILVQYRPHDAKNFEVLHSISAAQLNAPMHVRMRFDLDNPEAIGSLKIHLKEGAKEEFCALEAGTLPKSAAISGFRSIQQTTNGKNTWQVGDVVCVDDFSLTVQ
ncbi:MAG: Uncharacterised protein [Opitutia bacterium UBA7350]|nr:MAG: Uncharacterised protein [Opitutae bacterium UBA7350]